MPAGLRLLGPRGPAWGRNWLLKDCPVPICSNKERGVTAGWGAAVSSPVLPQPGSYRAVLAQLLALFLLQCCHRCRGCGRGCGSSRGHGSSSCCLGEVSSGPAGVRGEPHPSGATWATIVAGEQRNRKRRAVALQQGTCQAMRHRAGLTWQRSPAHWGRRCGHRHLAAHTPSLVPPRRKAAVAGMVVSSCPSWCLPCQAAAGCWSCSPQGPWGCQKPGGCSGRQRVRQEQWHPGVGGPQSGGAAGTWLWEGLLTPQTVVTTERDPGG